jgi:hypothetical protein
MVSNGEQATSIQSSGAPFAVLAFVIPFAGNVWDQMVGSTIVQERSARHYLAAILRFNILADVRCQDFVGDAELVAAAEHTAICD